MALRTAGATPSIPISPTDFAPKGPVSSFVCTRKTLVGGVSSARKIQNGLSRAFDRAARFVEH
jgi:hypothetical protein